MLLTATERLTMNTRPKNPANARNLNFCGIGSSGSGKTRFWLTPQLLQAHSSYVVVDPKGGVLGQVGSFLQKRGYKIKVFNSIDFSKSMQTINLKQYYPFCKEDIFVEVSDEIVEAFLLDKRAEAARERKMFRYKAFYSLDCNDGIENAAIGWAQPSPEDYLIEKEELAEYEELIRRLYEAISSLPPMQARRVHARYMLGMKVKDIAAMEGITPSQAGKSIHAALRRLRRYFARQKWTVNL